MVIDSRTAPRYIGLSTDPKPQGANGSLFLEIDTGKAFLYDSVNEEWHDAPARQKYATISGSVVSFSDGAAAPVKSLTAAISPVQDLHGQDAPYPAGGGANQWDEEWENGTYDTTTGEPRSVGGAINQIRSKNLIPVKPSTSYYWVAEIAVWAIYYDSDMGIITPAVDGQHSVSNNAIQMGGANPVYTTPANAAWVKFYCQASYGSTYKNDIAINYPAAVTTYAPYSNICPISGWDAANVTRTGKNLATFWKNAYVAADGSMPTANANGMTKLFKLKSGDKIYITKGDFSGAGFAAYRDANLTDLIYRMGSNATSYTATADCWAVVWFNQLSGIVTAEVFEEKQCQVEIGTTATAYAPYTGQTYSIDLGRTVYGGSLDVTNGVLTVDRAMVDLGDMYWTDVSASIPGGTAYACSISGKKPGLTNAICSMYPNGGWWTTWADKDKVWTGNAANASVVFKDSAYGSVADFKAAMDGVQLVYELATPQTYQLTPTEVETLLGDNCIWADTGDVEVVYKVKRG